MKISIVLLLLLNVTAYSQPEYSNLGGFPFIYPVSPQDGGGYKAHGLVVEDINGDGRPELIAAGDRVSGIGNNSIFVYEYTDNESVELIHRLDLPDVTGQSMSYEPCVCDADGDGYKEIVVAVNYSTYCYDYENQDVCGLGNQATCQLYSKVYTWTFAGGQPQLVVGLPSFGQFGTAVAADILGDNGDELVFVGPSGIAWRDNGAVLNVGRLTVLTWENGNWTQAYVDNDLADNHGCQMAFSTTCSEPAIGDINLDGSPEIVVALPSPAECNVNTQYATLRIYDFYSDPVVITTIEIPHTFLDRPTSGGCSFNDISPPILADMNADGYLEAIVPLLNPLPQVGIVSFYPDPSQPSAVIRATGADLAPENCTILKVREEWYI